MCSFTDKRPQKRKRRPELDKQAEIIVRGNVLQYKNGLAWEPPPGCEKREAITTFSDAARRRMIHEINAIDFRNTPLSVCITLTYPDEHIFDDQYARGMQRSMFLRKVETHLKREIYGIWRTEWLPRKTGKYVGWLAPHIHLVLFRIRWIHRDIVNDIWKSVLHHDGYLRTDTRRARKEKTTLHYLAKYVSKKVSSSLVIASYPNSPDGKHYDWIRRNLLPMYPRETISKITEEQHEYAHAAHKRSWPESETAFGESFTILGKSAMTAGKIIKQMELTPLGKRE